MNAIDAIGFIILGALRRLKSPFLQTTNLHIH